MSDLRPDQTAILARMSEFPLHHRLGFTLLSAADGRATAEATVRPDVLNAAGVLHGGVLYAVLDIAAFCAAVSVLPPATNAVTHDLHVQVLRASPPGATLHLEATVRKIGKRVLFVDVEARNGDAVVALGRVTKSLIPLG